MNDKDEDGRWREGNMLRVAWGRAWEILDWRFWIGGNRRGLKLKMQNAKLKIEAAHGGAEGLRHLKFQISDLRIRNQCLRTAPFSEGRVKPGQTWSNLKNMIFVRETLPGGEKAHASGF